MKIKLLQMLLTLCTLPLMANFKLYPSTDENCGINTYKAEDDTWKGELIFNNNRHHYEDFKSVGTEFFLHEYGIPLNFSQAENPLRKIGALVEGHYRIENTALQIAAGNDFSFTVGRTPKNMKAASIRFGEHWNNETLPRLFFLIDMEQDCEESIWEFTRYDKNGKPKQPHRMQIKGKGRKTFRIPCGNAVSPQYRTVGLTVACKKTVGNIRIYSIGFNSMKGDVFYRKTFELPFQPERAKLSLLLNSLADYDLFINGFNIARPTGSAKSVQVANFNIAKYLKKGRNTIAIRNRYTVLYRFISGSEPPNRLSLELFAYDRKGNSRFVVTDRSWKTTFKEENGWEKADFDDTRWQTPSKGQRLTWLANGKKVAMGLNPQHMGFISATPLNQKFPVFDAASDDPRGFSVSYPEGLKNVKLKVHIEHVSKNVKEELSAGKPINLNGFVTTAYTLKSTVPGPYRVLITLAADNDLRETCEEELILVGKIDQELFAYKDFEKELRKRMELVRTINALKEHVPGADFIACTTINRKNAQARPLIQKKNGIEFLTMQDAAPRSWMGWRIDTPWLGDAYIVEIDIPDVDDRTVNAAVVYSLPIALDNSFHPLGSSARIAASAAATTGGIQQNSNRTKTLTMLFHAANKISTILVTSPLTPPAAVCQIRLYHVKGNLPGLLLPETNREIMEHHERFTTWQTLSASSNIVEGGSFHPYIAHKNAWRYWYEGIERKIRQLRFQGQNASIEGMLMYDYAFYPSENLGNSIDFGEEFDAPYLMVRMYEKNGINCYFGWEVNRLHTTRKNLEKGISDRKIRNGEARGIYSVSAKGEQEQEWAASGINMLAPGIWEDFLASVQDVYQRYGDNKAVKGLFLAHGFYWLPGFLSLNNKNSCGVSFDDDSIELFEKMTKINLNTKVSDPERFTKREKLLNGKYRKEYYAWRKQIMTQKFREIRNILNSGRNPWKLALSLNFSHQTSDPKSPFLSLNSTRNERDNYIENRMALDGESIFPANKSGMTCFLPLGINPEYKWGHVEKQKLWSSVLTNRGTQALIGKANAVYSAYMLSERPVVAAYPNGKWYWKSNSALCVYQRPAGKAAYLRELQICRENVPQTLVIAGIDCHPYTGQAEECRRFAMGFYSIPPKKFIKTEKVTGVDARIADGYLRLYNDTPYQLTGFVKANCAFTEQVYGSTSDSLNTLRLTIQPYSMLVCKTEQKTKAFSGTFLWSKETVAEQEAIAKTIIEKDMGKLPQDCTARLKEALKGCMANPYELFAALNDPEVKTFSDKIQKSIKYLIRQNRMLNELKEKGHVRFNLADYENDYTDLDGNVWYADQPWIDMGTYGSEYGGAVNRGADFKIHKTRAPRIYQTERNGAEVFIYIPVPEGKYDVIIHAAETWDNKGRSYNVSCGNKSLTKINPLVNGFATPWIGVMKDVSPENGYLTLSFEGPAIAVNGFELIRK